MDEKRGSGFYPRTLPPVVLALRQVAIDQIACHVPVGVNPRLRTGPLPAQRNIQAFDTQSNK